MSPEIPNVFFFIILNFVVALILLYCVCPGIESLFNKINCDRSAIDDMLGAATGVTDGNMLQYLGIIEQRTNELLAIQTYTSLKVRL